MKTRHILIAAAITALLSGSALAYTYTIWKDDLPSFHAPSYATIIPTDSPLRNSVQQGACNGGFSPNPCGDVHTVPEPGIVFIFIWGLVLLFYLVVNKNRK